VGLKRHNLKRENVSKTISKNVINKNERLIRHVDNMKLYDIEIDKRVRVKIIS